MATVAPKRTPAAGDQAADRRGGAVPPLLDRLAAMSWRLLLVAAAVVAAVYALAALRLVVLPVIGALFLSTFLVPPARWLRGRGWPPLLAAWAVFVSFLGAVALLGWFIVPPVVDEFADLGDTVSQGWDDVQDWLQENLDVTQQQLDDVIDQGRSFARDSAGGIVSGAVLVLEVLAGLVLALVICFFLVKDGDRFQRWGLGHLPERHRDTARALGARAWTTLTGYLRGTAVIGLVEGVAIGLTLFVAGADLVVPVALLTFFAAFFPLVGAVVAGIIATLVALVSGGFETAVAVAVVCVVIQQVDGDLLAPLVLGRAVRLHPLVILLALTAGSAVAGLVGAFLAVPVTAVAVAMGAELRARSAGSAEVVQTSKSTTSGA